MKMYNHQGLAAVLSCIVPGLGQVYNGQGKMALVYFIIHCILVLFGVSTLYTAILENSGYEAPIFLFIVVIANIIWSATGAYNQALHHNAILEKEESEND